MFHVSRYDSACVHYPDIPPEEFPLLTVSPRTPLAQKSKQSACLNFEENERKKHGYNFL